MTENIQFKPEDIDFTDREVRKRFIQNTPSNLYFGKNVDGEEVVVGVDQGKGMSVKTLNSKGWYEGYCYDKNGFAEDEILEKAR